MKKILITNDDGYESEGLKALVDAVSDLGEVTVVAPATEKSACSHSITLTKPLRFIGIDDNFYKIDDGTPSDCIYLALHSLFDEIKPDIILSGINKGANLGEDITYSGTASGAMEGVIHGIPSLAFSSVSSFEKSAPTYNFDAAAKVARDLTKRVLEEGFPLGERRFLNVNVPSASKIKGYKITKAGYRLYGNDAHRHANPRGEEYYWLGLHPLEWRQEEGSDFDAVNQGFVSITPIKLDMTSYDDLKGLQTWL